MKFKSKFDLNFMQLEKLPGPVLLQLFLELTPISIGKLARCSKFFAEMVRDHIFWKSRFKKDFPHSSLDGVADDQIRDYYLYLYTLMLRYQATTVSPEIARIYKRKNELFEEMSRLDNQLQRLNQEHTILSNRLKQQASRIGERITLVIPLGSRRYLEYLLPSEERSMEFDAELCIYFYNSPLAEISLNNFEKLLSKYEIKYDKFQRYDLVRVTYKKEVNSARSLILYYVKQNLVTGDLTVTRHLNYLPRVFYLPPWTPQKAKEVYGLPFKVT